jgi:diguanylate cyclase (GGDEF)-like protein
MRLIRRQDSLLIAGLAAAVLIIFAEPLQRFLGVERTGFALVSALILLSGFYIVHQLRKRQASEAEAAVAVAARRVAEERARELERLGEFGHALARALDHDAIRGAIEEYLPRVAGTDQVWILLRQGAQWQALAGDTRGAEQIIQREELAERLLAGTRVAVASAQLIAIPLRVGGVLTGILGVRAGYLEPQQSRALEAAATLLAVSLKNSQLFQEVRENSFRDPLTGCATRNHAMEVIDTELRRARRSQMPISMIMFDLDHFKDVNDRHGQLCGDAVLSNVGRRMREVLRGADLKCRYGGEEFLVLLPETPLHGARRVAEMLRREIAERPTAWAGKPVTVTASFGLTQALPGEVNAHAIITRADAALYRAKEDGRNCVRIASDAFSATEGRKPNVVVFGLDGRTKSD